MFMEQKMYQRARLFFCTAVILSFSTLYGSPSSYKIYISDIQQEVTRKFLGIPKSVDYTVFWDVFHENGEDHDPVSTDLQFNFKLRCWDKNKLSEEMSEDTVQGNFFTFHGKRAGVKYGILVEGFQNGIRFAVSDTAWIVTGKNIRAASSASLFRWLNWIPLNGRIPLTFFERGYIFDGSTKAGKIAFHLIWDFFIIGCIIWFFFCMKYLSLRKVFPMKNIFHIPMSYDESYQKMISKDFDGIIQEWRSIVEKNNEHVSKEISQGDQFRVSDIEAENAKFWKEKGIVMIQKLLKKTADPKLNLYPSVKILHAGLEKHERGGFRWLEVSNEVDRAIESQASSELEQLRRRSLMDWLWNLGTMAPLLGLFGTVTGISHAFAMLTMLETDITQTGLVKKLAGGIFEALWTTIEGLFVGIIFMLLYYYYQNKLSWIYSKWEEIYVHIAEKL